MRYLLVTIIFLTGCQTPKTSPPIEDVIYLQYEDHIEIMNLNKRLKAVEISTNRIDDMILRGSTTFVIREGPDQRLKVVLLARPLDPNASESAKDNGWDNTYSH